jgi:hypothetical protein
VNDEPAPARVSSDWREILGWVALAFVVAEVVSAFFIEFPVAAIVFAALFLVGWFLELLTQSRDPLLGGEAVGIRRQAGRGAGARAVVGLRRAVGADRALNPQAPAALPLSGQASARALVRPWLSRTSFRGNRDGSRRLLGSTSKTRRRLV